MAVVALAAEVCGLVPVEVDPLLLSAAGERGGGERGAVDLPGADSTVTVISFDAATELYSSVGPGSGFGAGEIHGGVIPGGGIIPLIIHPTTQIMGMGMGMVMAMGVVMAMAILDRPTAMRITG